MRYCPHWCKSGIAGAVENRAAAKAGTGPRKPAAFPVPVFAKLTPYTQLLKLLNYPLTNIINRGAVAGTFWDAD
jgi:hypothetical protein